MPVSYCFYLDGKAINLDVVREEFLEDMYPDYSQKQRDEDYLTFDNLINGGFYLYQDGRFNQDRADKLKVKPKYKEIVLKYLHGKYIFSCWR